MHLDLLVLDLPVVTTEHQFVVQPINLEIEVSPILFTRIHKFGAHHSDTKTYLKEELSKIFGEVTSITIIDSKLIPGRRVK